MMKYRFYIGLMAAALLSVSCSQQEDIPALQEGKTVSRISLSRSADGGTASTIDGRYGTLTVYAYKGTDVDNSVEFQYENETEGWKQNGILKVPVPANDAHFIGMTGTRSETQNPFRFDFPQAAKNQGSDEGLFAADFMTSDRMALGDGNSLSLDFKHRMAKVTVKITGFGTELGGNNITLDDVRFKSDPAIMLNYDSETGEATVTSISGSDLDIMPAGSQDDGYTAIIAPRDSGLQLMVLNVTGKNEDFKVYTNTALKSGNHYTFNLKVGKDLVELKSVSITPWGATKSETGNTTNVALPEATDDGVGVFVHYGDNDPDNADNLKLSSNYMIEHVWKSMEAIPHIVIYSPYSQNATYDNIPLTHGTDHCFASVNADKSQTVSELIGGDKKLRIKDGDYYHVMGKLTLKFLDESKTTVPPTSIKFNNIFTSATLDKTGGINLPATRTGEMEVSDLNEILVIPQTFLKDVAMVVVTYNGKTFTYYPDKAITIGSGEHATLTLTIPVSSTVTAAQYRSTGAAPQRMEGTITIEKN